jgi:hypothetical protein
MLCLKHRMVWLTATLVLLIFAGCGQGSGAGGARVPTELIGVWVLGTMSDVINVDANGNPAGDRSGVGLYFKFNPDSSFGYAYSETVTNVGCTSNYFVYKSGRLEVAGAKLVLHPNAGRATYKDSCNPHTNTDKILSGNQLQDDPYGWQVVPNETNPNIANLKLTTPSGASGLLRHPD